MHWTKDQALNARLAGRSILAARQTTTFQAIRKCSLAQQKAQNRPRILILAVFFFDLLFQCCFVEYASDKTRHALQLRRQDRDLKAEIPSEDIRRVRQRVT
jgi:hypothetical protein